MNFFKIDVRPGPEDLAYLPMNGTPVLITGTAGRSFFNPKGKSDDGELWALALDSLGPKSVPQRIVRKDKAGRELNQLNHPFLPVGLYSLEKEVGRWFLYVINNPHSAPMAVEEYEVTGGVLTLCRRCFDETEALDARKGNLLESANSLAVTRDGRVYVSKLEIRLWRKKSKPDYTFKEKADKEADLFMTCFEDGNEHPAWHQVASGLPGANGVCLSPDEKTLYVSVYFAGEIRKLAIDPANGHLSEIGVLTVATEHDVGFFPDNISRGLDGRYYLSAQRGLFRTSMEFISSGWCPAPADIYSWDDTSTELLPVLAIDSKPYNFPAASTAFPYSGKLIISQVVGPELLVIDLT